MELWPALSPACSLSIIFSACGFILFSRISSTTCFGWLIWLMVWLFWQSCVSFLVECDDQGLGLWCWLFCFPDLLANGCEGTNHGSLSISFLLVRCPLLLIFSSFSNLTGASISPQRMGKLSSVTGGIINASGPPVALWLYNSEHYSGSQWAMSLSSVGHFPDLSSMMETCSCFVAVRSLTSYAFLLLITKYTSCLCRAYVWPVSYWVCCQV